MEVSSLILYKAGKILMVRDRYEDFWTLPGGKVEPAETKRQAIKREMKEELPLVSYVNLRFYKEFFGVTPHSQQFLVASVFVGQYAGGRIEPHAEITGARWIKKNADGLRMTQSTQNIIHDFYTTTSKLKKAEP